MTHKTIIRLLCVTVAFAALFHSCQKDTFAPNPNNPPEQMLPQAAFTVTVCEREPGVRGDSLYILRM